MKKTRKSNVPPRRDRDHVLLLNCVPTATERERDAHAGAPASLRSGLLPARGRARGAAPVPVPERSARLTQLHSRRRRPRAHARARETAPLASKKITEVFSPIGVCVAIATRADPGLISSGACPRARMRDRREGSAPHGCGTSGAPAETTRELAASHGLSGHAPSRHARRGRALYSRTDSCGCRLCSLEGGFRRSALLRELLMYGRILSFPKVCMSRGGST